MKNTIAFFCMLCICASGLSGCAKPPQRPATMATPAKKEGPYTLISMQKAQNNKSASCPIKITIFDLMPQVAWDGVSYHLALRNSGGVAIGEVRGIPLRYMEQGQSIEISAVVEGARCDDITSASLLYFGFYPTGRGQIELPKYLAEVTLR